MEQINTKKVEKEWKKPVWAEFQCAQAVMASSEPSHLSLGMGRVYQLGIVPLGWAGQPQTRVGRIPGTRVGQMSCARLDRITFISDGPEPQTRVGCFPVTRLGWFL